MKSDDGMWQAWPPGAFLPSCLGALQLCLCAQRIINHIIVMRNYKGRKNSFYSYFNNTDNTINSGGWLLIKVQRQLLKTWSNSLHTTVQGFHYCAAMKPLPCCITSWILSYTPSLSSEWLCSVVWTVLPLWVKGWQGTDIIQEIL